MAYLKIIYFFIVCTVIFSLNLSANGQKLYKKCRGCHGIDGKHVPFERKHGVIAGRDKVEIELIVRAIKDGSYSGDKLNQIMRKIIVKYSEEDIKDISEYIGKFKN